MKGWYIYECGWFVLISGECYSFSFLDGSCRVNRAKPSVLNKVLILPNKQTRFTNHHLFSSQRFCLIISTNNNLGFLLGLFSGLDSNHQFFRKAIISINYFDFFINCLISFFGRYCLISLI